jgi:hypothetical protein
MKRLLAICAIVKNEHDYFLEWLAYHRAVGVDHFLIYNNSGDHDDGTTQLLTRLYQSGAIELVPWPDQKEWRLASGVYLRPQIPAYYDGLQRLRSEFEWVGFIDIDEFIVPMKEGDLPSTLKLYENFGGVAANWKMFGTSGLKRKENALVCQRFTMASLSENRVNQHVKCIARTAMIRDVGVHRPFLRGGILVDEHGRELRNSLGFRFPVSYDFLRINHYYTKSWEEWLAKVTRGRASHPQKKNSRSVLESDFNDERDTSMAKFYPGIIEGMRELAKAANITGYPALEERDSQPTITPRRKVRRSKHRVDNPQHAKANHSSVKQAIKGAPQPYPILDVHLIGSFANRMVQYMVAWRVAQQVEDCVLSNAILPEWGIHHPILAGALGPEIHSLKSEQQADLAPIVEMLSQRERPRITLRPDLNWLSNFPDVEQARRLFPENEHDYPGFGAEYWVCDLRPAGAAADGAPMHHVLLPVEFYAELARTTGLKLAFIGKSEENVYVRALQERFPDAVFQASRGLLHDFQTFRNSKNLIVSISLFSWLAAWLSGSTQIVLPIDGLFHPVQEANVDLIPLADSRYQFYLFPINYSVTMERIAELHRVIEWHAATPEVISKLRTSRQPKRLDSFISQFDEVFYLKTYPDVANAVRTGGFKSGRDHYANCGFREGRNGFAFDQLWYSTAYLDAAWEVGRGEYSDLRHHYVEAGALRGYKAVPSASGF